MDRRELAEQLLEAERELRRAQAEHDGSERARRRYSDAVADLAVAERLARYFTSDGAMADIAQI